MARSGKLDFRGPPDPALSAAVRKALAAEGWRDPDAPKKEKPHMADDLPEGVSEEPQAPPEPLKMPEPTVLIKPRQPDEEVPAFGAITRVSLADQPSLTWLVARLTEYFPGIPVASWYPRMRAFAMDSSYFFSRTDHAVLLATLARDPLDAKAWAWPLFLIEKERGPEGGHLGGSQAEKDAIQLMRELARWGQHQGASEIRWIATVGRTDLPMNVYIQNLRAEKREELVIKIRWPK